MASSRSESLLRNIAANIRQLRLGAGWTQANLAEAAGLKERYVQVLETGTANPTVRVLMAVADALHVAPADLFATAKLPKRPQGRPPSAKQP